MQHTTYNKKINSKIYEKYAKNQLGFTNSSLKLYNRLKDIIIIQVVKKKLSKIIKLKINIGQLAAEFVYLPEE